MNILFVSFSLVSNIAMIQDNSFIISYKLYDHGQKNIFSENELHILKDRILLCKKTLQNEQTDPVLQKEYENKHELQLRWNCIKRFLQLLDKFSTGGDINMRDGEGWTLLHHAYFYYDHDLVGLLIKYGADANIVVSPGVQLSEQNIPISPFMLAVARRDLQAVKLFLEHGAQINTQDKEGISVLMVAVLSNNEELVNMLLKYKPNIELKDHQGKTAIDYAKELSLKNIENILMQAL